MHVGIVTYGYVPRAHVSYKRPYFMARTLVSLGHSVTIFTIDWRSEPGYVTVVEEGVRVVRVDPRHWNKDFSPTDSSVETQTLPAVIRKASTLRRTLTTGPYPSWLGFALPEMHRVHRDTPMDVIWAIHGDATAHEMAYRFHRKTGVPWVADFKDPWDLYHGSAASKAAVRVAMNRRLRSASMLTEIFDERAAVDSVTFGKEAIPIMSGYDHVLMEKAPPKRLSERFTLVHLGNISSQHPIDLLRETLQSLGQLPAPIDVHVFANQRERFDALGVRLTLHPFVDSREAFGLMKGADALFFIPATIGGATVGVKELEYLASGTPVISFGTPVESIRRVGDACGTLHTVNTRGEALEVLRQLTAQPGKFRTDVNPGPILPFAWSALGKTLEQTLLRACART